LKITISGAFGPNRDISSVNPSVRREGFDYIVDWSKFAFIKSIEDAEGNSYFIDKKKPQSSWGSD
jgi:hypothetical protein